MWTFQLHSQWMGKNQPQRVFCLFCFFQQPAGNRLWTSITLLPLPDALHIWTTFYDFISRLESFLYISFSIFLSSVTYELCFIASCSKEKKFTNRMLTVNQKVMWFLYNTIFHMILFQIDKQLWLSIRKTRRVIPPSESFYLNFCSSYNSVLPPD